MRDRPESDYEELSEGDFQKIRDLIEKHLPQEFDREKLISFLSDSATLCVVRDFITPEVFTTATKESYQIMIDSHERFNKAVLELVAAVEETDSVFLRKLLSGALKKRNLSEEEYKKVMSALVNTTEDATKMNARFADYIQKNTIGQGRKQSGRHYVTKAIAEQLGDRMNRTQKSKLISKILEILGVEATWQSINQKLRDSGL